jgi:energy-coupling factor transporter ATP-binding protein EcfA2
MPSFVVFSQSRGRAEAPGVWVLHRLPIDDDGYRTSWKLSLVAEDSSLIEIGTLKIIKSGQLAGRTAIDSQFTALGSDYGSLGAEPDFYLRLRKVAGPDTGAVLRALGDLATDAARRARFEAEPGFQTSLLRFTPARVALEEAAGIIATGATPAGTEASQKLVFHTSTGGSGFTISFDLESSAEVPSRVSVVIGPNGSGKTRLLANLALAAFEPDAADGGQPGRIEGTANFSRVLTFSYSAFDEFDLPAQTKTERAEFVRAGSSLGYRYFGLRDLAQKLEGTVMRPQLKTAGRIRNEFRDACRLALADSPEMLREIIGRLFREPSFAATGARVDEEKLGGLEKLLYTVFRQSSTGHKFVLLMTVQLVACCAQIHLF